MYLGIDLGTSNSAIVGNDGGILRLFKTPDGRDVLPSAVTVDRRGQAVIGAKAMERALTAPAEVALGFKRMMGTSTTYLLGGTQVSAEEVSAHVLAALRKQALSEALGATIDGTVITVPAAFNQMQIEATLRAARSAGFEKTGLLAEPVAAALSALERVSNQGGVFLIYDLGGGTFDVALVRGVKGETTVIDHDGINQLGGRDFDRSIVDGLVRPWLDETFNLPSNYQSDPRFAKLIRRVALVAEQAKIELSTADESLIEVTADDANVTDMRGRDVYVDIVVDGPTIDRLIRDRVDATVTLCRSLLGRAGYGADQIDRIVFICGPSKMKALRERVSTELGIPADMTSDPMTAVARGAAIYAEGRDWSQEGASTRKSARGSATSSGLVAAKFDYEQRTGDDRARLRITIAEPHAVTTVEITGGESYRVRIPFATKPIVLPLTGAGTHRFDVSLLTADDERVASEAIIVTRVAAAATGIPATQTISVKTLTSDGPFARNELSELLAKGTPLPASGSRTFRLARAVGGAGGDAEFLIELYQGARDIPDPELNLYLGAYRLRAEDFAPQVLAGGDEVVVGWRVDDNGIMSCTIGLPRLGFKLDQHGLYAPGLGAKNFAGDEGRAIASDALQRAERDLAGIAASGIATSEVTALRRRLERQRAALTDAVEPDQARAIDEEARHIRQDAARLTAASAEAPAALSAELDGVIDLFAAAVEHPDPAVRDRVLQLERTAQTAIAQQEAPEARRALISLHDVVWGAVWQEPRYVAFWFERTVAERHIAIDRALHDRLVKEGRAAEARADVDELRAVIGRLWQNQARDEPNIGEATALASLMRYGR